MNPTLQNIATEQQIRSRTQPSLKQEIKEYFFYFLRVFFIVVLMYVLVRTFVFDVIGITGESMAPNYSNGDVIYLDQLTPRFSDYRRGDTVVILPPKNDITSNRSLFIKRVIGLPGETVIFDSGNIRIVTNNGEEVQLKEEYIEDYVSSYKNVKSGSGRFEEPVLGDNEYFVMGDNRSGSTDSRVFGPIDKGNILGREFYRAKPSDKSGFYEPPTYNIPNSL